MNKPIQLSFTPEKNPEKWVDLTIFLGISNEINKVYFSPVRAGFSLQFLQEVKTVFEIHLEELDVQTVLHVIEVEWDPSILGD